MKVKLENIGIVLFRPHFAENIGAVVRVACNTGISRIILVDPINYDLSRVMKMATRAASTLVASIEIYEDLRDALADFNWVVGTTARTGSHRQTLRNPKQLARDLISITRENRVALVFGPEDRGLANRELKYCDSSVTIPTAHCSSLNLAQAVMIICYEIFTSSLDLSPPFRPRLANFHELEGMYDHLREVLINIDFLDPKNPDYWFQNLRRFFSRVGLFSRDVKVIRGICRQLLRYMENQSGSSKFTPRK